MNPLKIPVADSTLYNVHGLYFSSNSGTNLEESKNSFLMHSGVEAVKQPFIAGEDGLHFVPYIQAVYDGASSLHVQSAMQKKNVSTIQTRMHQP